MRRAKLPKSLTALTAVFAGATAALMPMSAAQAVVVKTNTKGTKEMSVQAGDDAYTSSTRKSANFGVEDKLVAGKIGTDLKTSFLKFTIPAGTDVTAAKLFLSPLGKPSGKISVNRVLDNSWTEGKLTSGNAPKLGLAIASVSPKTTDTRVGFDLSSEVYGAGTYSFAVSATETVRFQSAENAAKGGPELTFTTTSAPAAQTETKNPTGAPKVGTDCKTDAKLVPSCGVLWGGAAGGFTNTPRDIALKDWEKLSGRTASIFHQYHKGDEVFPTKSEIAMTNDPANPRVLLLNWKIAYGSDWSKVAKGEQDARIDAFAARAKAFNKKFFLVLNHEPENDVIAKAGSGWEAKDFAAMYRHTIERLRAKGVTNSINVMAYMGNEKWMAQSWWADLYPGNDVVDWMGLDSYVSVEKGYYHFGDFGDLLDRKPKNGGLGFYDWAVAKAPGKPFMVAEWGGYHRVGKYADKNAVYNDVLPELAKRPAIKAIVHFDTKKDDQGDRDISIDSTPASLAAFKKLAAHPVFNVKIG
ncbi:beta-mannanase [Actinoplanes lutulentus]|uniref:Glycosyl hydrolase family 26 n=1 Tax=Actinoplanes lutulentus TaxID=1287878 RepID=A0A327Z8L5_9ACTN|nr:DNRLRE domain-containing protein [Actinoplanes lutulentus]MBB2943612.1 beta-mannanase [Actinoplanes lutulentus]RAK27477.1 glycosyl hydrolase family 26 [Actinoplanes lutulentus]